MSRCDACAEGWGVEYHKRFLVTPDEKLRHHGFVIAARPTRGEAVWVDRDGTRWLNCHAMQYVAHQEGEAERMAAEDRKRGKR